MVVSCKSMSTDVPISLNMSFEAIVLINMVVDMVLFRLDSRFFVFLASSVIMSPRYLYDFVSLMVIYHQFSIHHLHCFGVYPLSLLGIFLCSIEACGPWRIGLMSSRVDYCSFVPFANDTMGAYRDSKFLFWPCFLGLKFL